MRATTVLSEGFLQRPGSRRSKVNLFVSWEDAEDVAPTHRFVAAKDVKVCGTSTNPPGTSLRSKSLPLHQRTRIDFVADDDDVWAAWVHEIKERFSHASGFFARFRLMLNLATTDAKSRKRFYTLSFCSVCTVVSVCVIMVTILSSFAIVGLRLAEVSYGAVDLEMATGGVAASAASLNYTRVSGILMALPLPYQAHSYRVDLSGRARRQASCTLKDGTVQSLWLKLTDENNEITMPNVTYILCQQACISDYCVGNAETVSMIVTDPSTDPAFADNATAHVGRALANLAYGSVMVSASLADALIVKAEDRLVINAVMDTALRHVFYQIDADGTANPNILLSVKVGAVIEDAFFPDKLGEFFVLFHPAHFTSLVVDAMAPSVSAEALAVARLVKPAEYATRIVFQLPAKERKETYLQSDFVRMRSRVQAWGALITEKIGANQITMNTPLLSFLSTMQFFTTFVGLIISIIILALSFVSTILIYTLLSSGLETSKYKLGVYRMIGFTRSHLVMLILTNTYFFTLPAWMVGLIVGQIGYWIVRAFIVHCAAMPLGLGISGAAVGWATLAGLGVPLVAALLPMRSLILMALPDALQTSRGRGGGVIYRIHRGRSRETDFLIVAIGFLGALSGFALYSFFPTSLITLNFSLMFYILFFVLVGMLGGLILLATNFEWVMETVVGSVFMFWEPAVVRSMVSKNLSAHRRCNRKTTLMYALSVGFLVFITVAFKIEITSLKYSRARSRGSDVTLYLSRPDRPKLGQAPTYTQGITTLPDGTTFAYEPTPLHPENMLGMTGDHRGLYFSDYVQLEHDVHEALGEEVVQAMTYRMTAPSGGNLFPVRQIRMRTFGRTKDYALNLNPLPPNFYEVVDHKFLRVNKYDTEVGRYGLVGGLYAESATNAAVIATTTNRVFGLRNLKDEFLFETHVSAFRRGVNSSDAALRAPKSRVELSAGRAVAVMDSSAVLLMTKFPNNMGEVLLSLPSAVRHTGVPYLSCNVLSLSAVFLRVASSTHYADVKAFLRYWLSKRQIRHSVRDLTTAFENIVTVDTIFTVFFVITQIVIMLICLFSLMSSMSENVLESSKEIGVLLSLGMSRRELYRVYVWEAFILVISSGLLGLLAGMTIAETMLLQSSLFTQLPIPFPFPYAQIIIVFVMGVGSALAASISPVTRLLGLPSIAYILRRVV